MIYALVGLMILQAFLGHIERRELLKRIMGYELREGKKSGAVSAPPVSAHAAAIKKWRGEAK